MDDLTIHLDGQVNPQVVLVDEKSDEIKRKAQEIAKLKEDLKAKYDALAKSQREITHREFVIEHKTGLIEILKS